MSWEVYLLHDQISKPDSSHFFYLCFALRWELDIGLWFSTFMLEDKLGFGTNLSRNGICLSWYCIQCLQTHYSRNNSVRANQTGNNTVHHTHTSFYIHTCTYPEILNQTLYIYIYIYIYVCVCVCVCVCMCLREWTRVCVCVCVCVCTYVCAQTGLCGFVCALDFECVVSTHEYFYKCVYSYIWAFFFLGNIG